ncbi:MAG: nitroreductase family deazaflavin-dependent oxidoreductase [Acidimicrobiales bacterium]|nr:nitroreductase family deazaflavin-dependent oxidoreductase [Acidimicrobiales bacterium]
MGIARTGQKLFTGFHVWVYRTTGGRIGRRIGSIENVLLTTTGRRTGQARTTPLTATIDDDRVVLVASNGGAPRHPDWYLNLVAHPEVTVQRGADVQRMGARTAGPEERAVLWPRVVSTYKGYEGYQCRAPREIPIVICEPTP